MGNLSKILNIKSRPRHYSIMNAKEKYKFILEAVNEIIWEVNFYTRKLRIIGNLKGFCGYDNREIVTIDDFIDKIVSQEDKEKVKDEFNEYLYGKSIYVKMEFRIKTKNNEEKWILAYGKAISIADNIKKFIIGSITDVTDKKKSDEQIIFMAYHDMLTKLPNRAYFLQKLQKALGNNKEGAVICIDIDNFRDINDLFGHNYGDVLLKIIGEILKISIEEYGMVAKMGGDGFLVLVPEIKDKEYLKGICDRIMDNFKCPFEIMDVQIYTSITMGIALFKGKSLDKNEILKDADIAMHYAKSRGKGNYVFYDSTLERIYKRKKEIESELQNAINNKQLELYYQPQVDIESNRIIGLEALLRWNSPTLGMVPPDEFIKIAEESGLMYEIGEWVLKEACRQAKEWVDKNYEFNKISINVSPVQIKNNYFLSLVENILKENNLNSNIIEIEITESTLIESIEEKSKLLNKLIEKNIKIAIDDFGKGYSSLNYLATLPINTLKIDKSFVDKICIDDKSLSIVECIISLSKRLNYNSIAEGVEVLEQKEILKNIGCSCIQGYYYSKPLPASLIEKILDTVD